jgi:hypothetical protein
MTGSQMAAMLAWPGTYEYVCDICGEPTYCHTIRGPVLYHVTDEDRAAQAERAHHH